MKNIKIIIPIFIILILSTTIMAETTDPTSYFKLDNNNFSDELGSYDLTNDGTSNTTGIIIDGRDFSNDKLDAPANMVGLSTNLSINMWVYPDRWIPK